MSRPVTTARTPSSASAREASMETMRAWGCGLRRILPCSMPGSEMSSVYAALPVALASPSTLRWGLPTSVKDSGAASGPGASPVSARAPPAAAPGESSPKAGPRPRGSLMGRPPARRAPRATRRPPPRPRRRCGCSRVQRQRLPASASRIVARLGASSRSSKATAEHRMPGVQKPHCAAPFRSKASCSGCGRPAPASPSTVRTSRPSTSSTGVMHDRWGAPSTMTVHAPQSPLSQPCLEPVSPMT